MKQLLLAAAALVAVAAVSTADAATILVFGQSGTGNTTVATTNGANTQTTITNTNTPVTITAYAGGGTPISAFLDITATSIGAATLVGTDVHQDYSGSFTITSLAGGLGTNYLSGTFSDAALGSGPSVTLQAGQPPETVTFTSGVLAPSLLNVPTSLGFTFTNLADPPGAHIVGTTLAPFTASVAGDMSASPVTTPEPASLALLGVGVIGLGVIGRRRSKR